MWDLVNEVLSTYENWRQTLWTLLKVDDYLPINEGYIQKLKKVPREVKNFRAFKNIQELVQNMKRALNCADMLTSEAMKDRHWLAISDDIG